MSQPIANIELCRLIATKSILEGEIADPSILNASVEHVAILVTKLDETEKAIEELKA